MKILERDRERRDADSRNANYIVSEMMRIEVRISRAALAMASAADEAERVRAINAYNLAIGERDYL